MTVNRHIQFILKLLRRLLLDSTVRPCLLYVWKLLGQKFSKLRILLSRLVSGNPKDKKSVHFSHQSNAVICASQAFPFFGTNNASKSSQDLGLLAMEGFAFNEVSCGQRHQEHVHGELSIVIDPPPNDNGSIKEIVQSPEELYFDTTAGDVPDVTSSMLSEAHPSFYPTTPETVEEGRYTKEVIVDDEELEYTIQPLTTSFTCTGLPEGWKPCTHPEGALYFFHERLRIFTDANLYDSNILLQLDDHIMKLEDFMRAQNLQLDPDVDTVLDFYQSGDAVYWCYYFASHKHRVVFWMDDFDAKHLTVWSEVKGVTSSSHLGHELEAQYWLHCQLYPNARRVTCELVDELRDVIMHAICDTFVSRTSTAPYSNSDLHQLLSLTNGFRKSANRNMIGTNASFSRLMHIFVRQRFYNFYSQTSARLDRDHSVYGHKMLVRSPLVTFFSPILFYAPDVHLRSLQKIWVDRLLHLAAWTHFVNKVSSEWQEFILYATVLLNANVAFLAIQSVDSTSDVRGRSPAQISSYISIVASLGCILLGLLLVRSTRTKGKETAHEAANFLKRQKHPTRGLETLAILYALPYSLLLYGMVAFLVAFSFTTFSNASFLVCAIVGSAWLAIVVLILWSIVTGWESRHNELNFWSVWWKRVSKDTAAASQPEREDPSPSSPRKKRRRFTLPRIPTFKKRTSSYASSITMVQV